MTDKILPNLPSALIRLALRDLEEVRRDPRYKINMGTWHEPIGCECAVCLAGSVMAKSLSASETADLVPVDFGVENHKKLLSIDFLRTGRIVCALDELGLPFPHDLDGYIDIAPYHDDPDQFILDMTNLANLLESKGL